jgi:RNA polymerase sigma factor (sigma-70 family)
MTDSAPPDERGDDITVLYAASRDAMVRLAHLLTGDDAAAQDLVHDAFIKVARRTDDANRGRTEPIANPPAYLRRAVVNACHDWHRHQATRRRLEPPVDEPVALTPEDHELWSALATIAPKRRMAIVLRFYEDLPLDEVASVMGVRPGTARSLIHRGLASLRKVIDHDD